MGGGHVGSKSTGIRRDEVTMTFPERRLEKDRGIEIGRRPVESGRAAPP
jgi:hypothetical protein